MGKIFKFGCLGFIGLIVLGIIGSALGGGDDEKKNLLQSQSKKLVLQLLKKNLKRTF